MNRVVLWCAALMLAGCGAQEAAAPTAVSAPPTVAPAPTDIPTPAPAANEFVNPVLNQDFPDPDIVQVGDTYYAYATNAGGMNVQSARSTDLVTWEHMGDALPALPDWAAPGLTWAPEVMQAADGTFRMYVTARDIASDKQCIGVAAAPAPEGPFDADDAAPLVCEADIGGSIDASSFVDDDGTPYLLWKNDGNCCGFDTWLSIQQLAEDGRTLVGTPTRLIKQDQPWEGALVEAPTLWKHENRYYLFYSANSYAGPDYAIGWAVADAPTGPFTKGPGPLLVTNPGEGAVIGPGGQDVVRDQQGDTWLVYHGWEGILDYRAMFLDELVWQDGTPVVQGPDRAPQPRP